MVPKAPTKQGRPRRQHRPESRASGATPSTRDEDPTLWRIYDEVLALDPEGSRFAFAIRQAFDQIYDGQRTGRWDYSQLMKTEKTHIGTLVEMWLQREFQFKDGEELDYLIAGVDVDAKWSRNLNEWEIPLEMYSRGDKIAMLLWANEDTARMAVGLIRITDDVLKAPGKQRDGKRRLNDRGCDSVLWIHCGTPMIANTLLHLPDELMTRISRASSGQAAVTLLFREVTEVLIDRAAVVTAAQQFDAMKRVRDARKPLRKDGIALFGHYNPHPDIAEALALPRPTLARFISARLSPWQDGDPEPHAAINGTLWRLARQGEVRVSAPVLPDQGQRHSRRLLGTSETS